MIVYKYLKSDGAYLEIWISKEVRFLKIYNPDANPVAFDKWLETHFPDEKYHLLRWGTEETINGDQNASV